MYKVLITTSGTGSRLKELTKATNKALIQINDKVIIDEIISAYPPEIELVFTLGYFGDKVREYITKKYPTRQLTFIDVTPYEGVGSSLGYSMLQAKDALQCPFIFHCNDTIISGSIPSPEQGNWDGVSKGTDAEIFNTASYSTVKVVGEKITEMQGKHAQDWDYFHIGVVGIKDYIPFWNILGDLYQKNPNDSTLNDCAAITLMLEQKYIFKPVVYKEWYDTGNPLSFDHAKRTLFKLY